MLNNSSRINYCDTEISCGISQLYHIRGADQALLKKKIEKLVFDYQPTMIVASLTVRQKKEIKLLKANGFKPVNKPRKNYNSGNKIILFVKLIPESFLKKVKSDFEKKGFDHFLTD